MLGPTLLSIPFGFLIAAPLTALLVRIGRRAGTLDSQGTAGHAKELRAVPNIGGIAIAAATLGPLAIGLIVLALAPGMLGSFGVSADSFADRLDSERSAWWTIVIGGIVMHAVGLYDDRRALPPLPKLFVQLGVAAAVVVVGGLRLFTVLDAFGGAGIALSATLTVAWIVVICNAINFLPQVTGAQPAPGTVLCCGRCGFSD